MAEEAGTLSKTLDRIESRAPHCKELLDKLRAEVTKGWNPSPYEFVTYMSRMTLPDDSAKKQQHDILLNFTVLCLKTDNDGFNQFLKAKTGQ